MEKITEPLGMEKYGKLKFIVDILYRSYVQSIKRIIVSLLGGHILLLIKDESLQDIISKTYLEKSRLDWDIFLN